MAFSKSYKYKHIFFDLDHTLWDFEGNSRKTLAEIYHQFELASYGITSPDEFVREYEVINYGLWHQYRQKKIDKPTLRNTRFNRVLAFWDIENDDLAYHINETYLVEGPKKTGLLPNTLETLRYLFDRYPLHLITNGFKEVQNSKLDGSGLRPFFKNITTSEETGFLKPDVRVFEIALNSAGAQAHESLYVGDHYDTDIVGGQNAGIDQVFFNPEKNEVPGEATYVISDLKELKMIL